MELRVKDENGEVRAVTEIWRGSEDGTPVKLVEGTPEFEKAVRFAILKGVLV